MLFDCHSLSEKHSITDTTLLTSFLLFFAFLPESQACDTRLSTIRGRQLAKMSGSESELAVISDLSLLHRPIGEADHLTVGPFFLGFALESFGTVAESWMDGSDSGIGMGIVLTLSVHYFASLSSRPKLPQDSSRRLGVALVGLSLAINASQTGIDLYRGWNVSDSHSLMALTDPRSDTYIDVWRELPQYSRRFGPFTSLLLFALPRHSLCAYYPTLSPSPNHAVRIVPQPSLPGALPSRCSTYLRTGPRQRDRFSGRDGELDQL